MPEKTEQLDVYDSTGKWIGSEPRELVHAQGLWHRTIHVWVIYNDDDNEGRVVLQKRSEKKNSWPGYFDITAAGHYLAGEGFEEGVREIEEEIGISPKPESLIPLGVRVCVEDFKPGVINREFQDVFLLIDSRPLEAYSIQLAELDGLVKPRVRDLVALFRKDIDTFQASGLRSAMRPGGSGVEFAEFQIVRDKFIPTLDNYYYKVMVLARRALAGDPDLLI